MVQKPNNNIKLLHIITGLGLGGAEKVVLDLTTHLNQNGYNCTVATINNEVERVGQFKANNISLLIGSAEKKSSSVLNSFQQIVQYVKKQKITLIHAHLFHGLMAAYYVKLFCPSVKIVFSPHSISLGSKLRERFTYLTKNLRNIDLILHQNNLRNFIKKIYYIIPNGVTIPNEFTRNSGFDKFVFLAIGNLREEKNHILLLNVAKKLLAANFNNFEIQIAGEGKMRQQLEAKISRLQLHNYIKLLGKQLNVSPLYKKANAFVLPSKWEGMPLSVLEAASYQLPVICTPVGSLTEIINQQNGYLVAEDQFHNAMISVLQNYDAALLKAKKLKQWVAENYNHKILFKQYEKVYEDLLLAAEI